MISRTGAAQLRRTTDVQSSWSAVRRMIPAAALILAAATASGGPANGQGRFEARYSVTIAGIPVGQGVWIADIAEDQYTTAASGRVTGLARVLTDGEGSGAARGRVHSGRLTPTSYAVTVMADRRPDEVRMAFAGGGVKDLQVWPPLPHDPNRVPLTDAHRRGVLDPLSAGLVFVGGTGEVVSQDACRRTVPIFDGRQRYDLTLAFKRIEQVRAEKGYEGPVVVCMVVYQPVAGYRPDRPAIRQLAESRDMDIWFAPIVGTRFLAPFRISMPTLVGTAVLQADQFVTYPVRGGRPTAARSQ
jgi:Protein of unknown function (DUF3108)